MVDGCPWVRGGEGGIRRLASCPIRFPKPKLLVYYVPESNDKSHPNGQGKTCFDRANNDGNGDVVDGQNMSLLMATSSMAVSAVVTSNDRKGSKSHTDSFHETDLSPSHASLFPAQGHIVKAAINIRLRPGCVVTAL